MNEAGNLTRDKDGYQYEYDYENRIVKITKDSNDIAEFTYDALGRRIQKKDLVDPNNTRLYYYNHNWQVLCGYDDSNNVKSFFIYGNYIDEVVYMFDFTTLFYGYYVHDHLYSPAALIDSSGTVQERYEYDAYGNCSILEPNFAPDPDGKSGYGNPYLFTGRRLDILDNSSLKIQYNRNRYYDYYTGRWLTHDPLGITPYWVGGSSGILPDDVYPGQVINAKLGDKILRSLLQHGIWEPRQQYLDGMNLYQYVKSKTTSHGDPYGLKQCNCGPDITHVLRKLAWDVAREWDSSSWWHKRERCLTMYDPFRGWDIHALTTGRASGRPAPKVGCCPSGEGCKNTVTVCRHCYRNDVVNYWLWGRINWYCSYGFWRFKAVGFADLWKRVYDPVEGAPEEVKNWVKAGFDGRFCAGATGTLDKKCKPCVDPWTHTFTWHWGTRMHRREFGPFWRHYWEGLKEHFGEIGDWVGGILF